MRMGFLVRIDEIEGEDIKGGFMRPLVVCLSG